MPGRGMTLTEREMYDEGFKAGMIACAWWKDEVEWVGTCRRTLKDAVKGRKGLVGYVPRWAFEMLKKQGL